MDHAPYRQGRFRRGVLTWTPTSALSDLAVPQARSRSPLHPLFDAFIRFLMTTQAREIAIRMAVKRWWALHSLKTSSNGWKEQFLCGGDHQELFHTVFLEATILLCFLFLSECSTEPKVTAWANSSCQPINLHQPTVGGQLPNEGLSDWATNQVKWYTQRIYTIHYAVGRYLKCAANSAQPGF